METFSALHPDADGAREEPGPRSVIRPGNEMGRKAAKWLPGALASTRQHMHSVMERRSHILHTNAVFSVLLLKLNAFVCPCV